MKELWFKLEKAHRHCGRHREEVLSSEVCGCFYCLSIFSPEEIDEWIDWDDNGVGQTGLCPKCGIDSVIGSRSGFPIAEPFLKKMKKHWFNC